MEASVLFEYIWVFWVLLSIIEYFGYYRVSLGIWVLLSILGIFAYFGIIGSSNFWFYVQSEGRVTLAGGQSVYVFCWSSIVAPFWDLSSRWIQ